MSGGLLMLRLSVVSLAALPRQEMGASASGNGSCVRGPCAATLHNFSRRPTSRLLSLLYTSKMDPP